MEHSNDVARLRRQYRERRRQAFQAWHQRHLPDRLLAALKKAADTTVLEVLRICPLPDGACLAAVGGYGRGELYPGSDLDILILLGRPADAMARAQLEALVAALWDAGLEPAHSVRTLEQCRQQAAADISVQTSLLESRRLAGAQGLYRQFQQTMLADLDPRKFFLAKRSEMQQRHARHNDTPYALEPNCKESPGGLRDLHLLLWLARAAGLGSSWRQVAQNDLLTPAELRALRRAEQAFKRLRIELHLLAGRREDRVLFDLQPRLAQIYGFADQPHRRASEVLMQRYYWAARVVSQLNRLLLQSLEEHLFAPAMAETTPLDADFCIRRERLALVREDAFERNPSLLLKAFLLMQQHPGLKGMSAGTMRAIWHARRRIDQQFRTNPVNRYNFLQILQQPHGVFHALQEMSTWNILPRYLPVFRRIVGQMQHDLFHAYTVDQHILMVMRKLHRFGLPEHAHEHTLASELYADFDGHYLLYIAALFHDIAKGRGGDHSGLGAREVRIFAQDHGLHDSDTELLVFLVREHLAMSLVAQKRDLSDPRVIHGFVRLVGTKRRLAALYMLTVADICGTSPRVWNAWKARLLENLYFQTLAALGGAETDTNTVLAQRKAAAAAEIRAHGLDDASRDSFWSQLDVAYFLRHESGEIAWHTLQLHGQQEKGVPVVHVRTLEQGAALQILVYAPDRTFLFVDICTYFDRSGLSVQDARIHTSRQSWALDSFVVLLPDAGDLDQDHDHAGLIERELLAALQQQGPARRRSSRHQVSRRSRTFPLVPDISLQAGQDGSYWRLSVTAADRIGLLHDLALVFAMHDVNLRMAKILTLGDRVEDIFILESPALDDPHIQLLFEHKIMDVLNADLFEPADRQHN